MWIHLPYIFKISGRAGRGLLLYRSGFFVILCGNGGGGSQDIAVVLFRWESLEVSFV